MRRNTVPGHFRIVILKHDAAFGVDITETFMPPNGGLAVPHGEEVVPVALRIFAGWPNKLKFVSRDAHAKGNVTWHTSFVGYPAKYLLTYEEVKAWTPRNHRIAPHALFTLRQLKYYLKRVGYQILWDEHGDAEKVDSRVHPALSSQTFICTIDKGKEPCRDSYGAVHNALGKSNGLLGPMRRHRVKRVFVFGLAFDYCVIETAIQLAQAGFEVFVVLDATKSIDLPANPKMGYPGSVLSALSRAVAVGVKFVNSDQLMLNS